MPYEESNKYDVTFLIDGKPYKGIAEVKSFNPFEFEDDEEEKEDTKTYAEALYSIYQSYLDAGFQEKHAFQLLMKTMPNHKFTVEEIIDDDVEED